MGAGEIPRRVALILESSITHTYTHNNWGFDKSWFQKCLFESQAPVIQGGHRIDAGGNARMRAAKYRDSGQGCANARVPRRPRPCPGKAQGISCTPSGWQPVCAPCGENHRSGTPLRDRRSARHKHTQTSRSCSMYGRLPPQTLQPASKALDPGRGRLGA